MKIILLAFFALVAALVVAASAPAGVLSHPTLTMIPAVPQVGDYLTFVGCGFNPNGGPVTVLDNQPGNNFDEITVQAERFVGVDGCFNTTGFLYTQDIGPGKYRVSASQDKTKVMLSFYG